MCGRPRHACVPAAVTALVCQAGTTTELLAYFSLGLNPDLNLIKDESGLEIFSYDTFYGMVVQ